MGVVPGICPRCPMCGARPPAPCMQPVTQRHVSSSREYSKATPASPHGGQLSLSLPHNSRLVLNVILAWLGHTTEKCGLRQRQPVASRIERAGGRRWNLLQNQKMHTADSGEVDKCARSFHDHFALGCHRVSFTMA